MLLLPILLALAAGDPESLAESLRRAGAGAVRIERVQLDLDAELEAIVRWERNDTGAHAAVLDHVGNEWREAGRVNTWWSYVAADGQRLIETRPTVDAGQMDLLVRVKSGETEHVRQTLTVFRLRAGRLVNVLEVPEFETAMEHPSGEVFTTTTTLTFGPGQITVRSRRTPGGRTGCALYVWNEEQYRFDERRCEASPHNDGGA